MPDDLDKMVNMLEDVLKNLELPETESEKREKALKHLWKTDDPEWVEQRENEWRMLVEDNICDGYTAKKIKALQALYVHAEEPPSGQRLSPDTTLRFFMTPFTTVEEAQEVYALVTTHPTDKHGILTSFMGLACRYGQRMPWLRERILLFIEGVRGKEYKLMEMPYGKGTEVISPEPTSFCVGYPLQTIKYFTRGAAYDSAVDDIPYLISALPHADDANMRRQMFKRRGGEMKLEIMFDEASRVLDEKDEGRPLAKQLANDLLEQRDEIFRLWKLHEHLDQQ